MFKKPNTKSPGTDLANQITPMEDNKQMQMNLGKNISELRKKNNMTQEELANRLGISPQAVSKWENESSCPDIALLPELACIFGITIDELMTGEKQSDTNKKNTLFGKTPSRTNHTIQIDIINQIGKKSTIKLPLGIVKTGLKIGSMFGLDNNTADAIGTMAESENFGEVVNIDGDNGEKISIKII